MAKHFLARKASRNIPTTSCKILGRTLRLMGIANDLKVSPRSYAKFFAENTLTARQSFLPLKGKSHGFHFLHLLKDLIKIKRSVRRLAAFVPFLSAQRVVEVEGVRMGLAPYYAVTSVVLSAHAILPNNVVN